jgi:hypothetical protein
MISLKETEGSWFMLTPTDRTLVLLLRTPCESENCTDINGFVYDTISCDKNFNSCRNKLSSIKCKAFKIVGNVI